MRSFTIAGEVLPFCQRCTGVYMGLGIGIIYLLLSREAWKGLFIRSIIYVNTICMLIMPVFGFHLIDPGPSWRLWSGLIFGNAIAFLLLPATVVLCKKTITPTRNSRVSLCCFFVLFVFISFIPFWFPIQSAWFYFVVLILSLLGIFGVVFCLGALSVIVTRRTIFLIFMKGYVDGYQKH
ncbi:MAG: DUF2085 domain-containing protein [Sedimentisphaerales bacterium]|nr:DUF2085 domain-containing protein [Sedimentisphaerales bacterium]